MSLNDLDNSAILAATSEAEISPERHRVVVEFCRRRDLVLATKSDDSSRVSATRPWRQSAAILVKDDK